MDLFIQTNNLSNTDSGDMYVCVWNQGEKWFSNWKGIKFED